MDGIPSDQAVLGISLPWLGSSTFASARSPVRSPSCGSPSVRAGSTPATWCLLTGTDPALGPDVDVWCTRFGHRVVTAERDTAGWRIRVELTSRGRDWVAGTQGGQGSNSAGGDDSGGWHRALK